MNLQAEIPFNYNPWSVSSQTIRRIWISVFEDTDRGAEVISVLLLAALVGSIFIAQKKKV